MACKRNAGSRLWEVKVKAYCFSVCWLFCIFSPPALWCPIEITMRRQSRKRRRAAPYAVELAEQEVRVVLLHYHYFF